MTRVKLRYKPISGRRISLYLDFYPAIINPETKKPTRREFLKLYLYDRAQNVVERDHNKQTKLLAEKICSLRAIDIGKGEFGFLEADKNNVDFFQFYRELCNKRKDVKNTFTTWQSSFKYFELFSKGSCLVKDLTEKFCNDYRDFLLRTPSIKNSSTNFRLSQNAAHAYFNKFKAALKQAYKDGLLRENLNEKIEPIRQLETNREFLSLEELQKLANTECDNPILKRAALFSALTGLRWGDIKQLTWEHLNYSEAQGHFIRFTQKKTKGAETLPISEQARGLLGDSIVHGEPIFHKLHYSAYFKVIIGKWLLSAGISKNITFHNFRHTFATLQLAQGTDIYTVSKMLGHRDLKTTQVYAKIVDQKKREAADKIKL